MHYRCNNYVYNYYFVIAFILLIQAYHRNMISPHYVWITPGWYQNYWWKSYFGSANKNCTREIMELAVNGSLSLLPRGMFPLQNDSALTTSGIVSQTNHF